MQPDSIWPEGHGEQRASTTGSTGGHGPSITADVETSPATSPGGERSPVDRVLDGTGWSRADAQLALQAVNVVLLALFVHSWYHVEVA